MRYKLWATGDWIECAKRPFFWVDAGKPYQAKSSFTKDELLKGLSRHLFFFKTQQEALDYQKEQTLYDPFYKIDLKMPAVYEVEVEELDLNINAFQIIKVLSAQLQINQIKFHDGTNQFKARLDHLPFQPCSIFSCWNNSYTFETMTQANYKADFEALRIPYQMNALMVCLDKHLKETHRTLSDLVPNDVIRYGIFPRLTSA